jgi:hypothetical protein
MNDAIKRIKQGRNVLVRIFENAETGAIKQAFSNDVLLNKAGGCKWAMPVGVFLFCDLAFFPTVLGEVNSSEAGVSGAIFLAKVGRKQSTLRVTYGQSRS